MFAGRKFTMVGEPLPHVAPNLIVGGTSHHRHIGTTFEATVPNKAFGEVLNQLLSGNSLVSGLLLSLRPPSFLPRKNFFSSGRYSKISRSLSSMKSAIFISVAGSTTHQPLSRHSSRPLGVSAVSSILKPTENAMLGSRIDNDSVESAEQCCAAT
jgi:hypothetical protein